MQLLFFRSSRVKMEVTAVPALSQGLAPLKIQVPAHIREIQLIISAEDPAQLRASQLTAGIVPQAFSDVIYKMSRIICDPFHNPAVTA